MKRRLLTAALSVAALFGGAALISAQNPSVVYADETKDGKTIVSPSGAIVCDCTQNSKECICKLSSDVE